MSYRYLGNKARISDWITDLVQEAIPSGGTIGDLMCGTAAMSVAFAQAGYRVVASDQLKFATLHAQARLLKGSRAAFAELGLSYESAIDALNQLPPKKGFFWREYSDEGCPTNGAKPRSYFSGVNAARIDAIREQVKTWRQEGIAELAADLLVHDLTLAANRVANIAGTYGFYRSTWSRASLSPLSLRTTPYEGGSQSHLVLNGPAQQTISSEALDAVYLDPPYTKRQYAGNYHVIETLACADEPILVGEGGLRDWRSQASDFCYRRRAAAAFESILSRCRAPKVFISYSEDAQLKASQLFALLKNFGSVTRYERALPRYKSNNGAQGGAVLEHLYVVEMANAGATESSSGLEFKDQPQRSLQH